MQSKLPSMTPRSFRLRVKPVPHLLNGPPKGLESLQVIPGREDRDDVPVGGDKGRGHEEPEFGRRIDDHDVSVTTQRLERLPEPHAVLVLDVVCVEV